MSTRKSLGLLLFSLLILAGAIGMAVTPAEALVADPKFSAGDYNDGICSCPVTVGNCVCKFTPPDSIRPSLPSPVIGSFN